MATEKMIPKYSWAIENAIAQQRLEGLEVSEAVIADMQRVERGEITTDDVITNIIKR